MRVRCATSSIDHARHSLVDRSMPPKSDQSLMRIVTFVKCLRGLGKRGGQLAGIKSLTGKRQQICGDESRFRRNYSKAERHPVLARTEGRPWGEGRGGVGAGRSRAQSGWITILPRFAARRRDGGSRFPLVRYAAMRDAAKAQARNHEGEGELNGAAVRCPQRCMTATRLQGLEQEKF